MSSPQRRSIVGGLWGYYKFVRGRTFHRRAEIDVTGAVVSRSPLVVRGKVTLTNTGSANIPLRAAKLRVSKFQPGHIGEQTGYKDWSWLGSGDLFEDHEWVESQETIADDVLVQFDDEVPRDCPLRLSVVVLPKPKRKLYAPWKTKGTGWFGQCVLPVAPDVKEKGERSA